MLFEWDHQKNEQLKRQRNISFEEIVEKIDNGFLLDQIFNPRYPDQEILIVNIKNYAWAIPSEQRSGACRLITAYPSRSFTKKYL